MSGPVDVLAVICPWCKLAIDSTQPSHWHVNADSFGFRNSRAPTRRYRVHNICPNFYSKQLDQVNAKFDAAIASIEGCHSLEGYQAGITALNAARAFELAQINDHAALANVGGAK